MILMCNDVCEDMNGCAAGARKTNERESVCVVDLCTYHREQA
jgi:hypothetical protein